MTLKELEKRLKKEPDNLGLRVQVAGLMREAGRSTEAVELYRSVALAYRDQGRTQQAVAVCRAILEIAPDDERCIALLSTLQGRSTPSIPSIAPPPLAPPAPAVARAPTRPPPGPSQPPPARPSQLPLPPSRVPAAPSQPPPPLVAQPPKTSSQPPPPMVGQPPKTSSQPPAGQPPKTSSQPPGGQPPKTSSRPPPVIVIPPKPGGVTIPPRAPARAASESTPAPAPSRPPTEPAAPSPVTARLPLEPPTRKTPSQPPSGEPKRRSSMEETPLPRPVPHHVHDPTGRNARMDPEDLDTNPEAEPRRTKSGTGLAEAARKISDRMKAGDDDISRPLDTRPVRRITSDELEKIVQPPPTAPHERLSDESITAVPGDDEELTTPRDKLDPDDV